MAGRNQPRKPNNLAKSAYLGSRKWRGDGSDHWICGLLMENQQGGNSKILLACELTLLFSTMRSNRRASWLATAWVLIPIKKINVQPPEKPSLGGLTKTLSSRIFRRAHRIDKIDSVSLLLRIYCPGSTRLARDSPRQGKRTRPFFPCHSRSEASDRVTLSRSPPIKPHFF